MNYNIVTPVATEPLALDDVKAHLRVDFDDDDSIIIGLITVARELQYYSSLYHPSTGNHSGLLIFHHSQYGGVSELQENSIHVQRFLDVLL